MIPRVARRVLRAALHALGDAIDKHGALVDRGTVDERVRDLDELCDERDGAMRERDEALAKVKVLEERVGRAEQFAGELAQLAAVACVYTPHGSPNELRAMQYVAAWLHERGVLQIPPGAVLVRGAGAGRPS